MEGRFNYLTLVFVAVLLGTYVTGTLSCSEDMYTGHHGLCCKLCEQGTHLIKPCNESKGRSFCQQCPPQTYMDKANNQSECEPCIKCGPSQVVLVECAPNKNRECGCEKGKYLDLDVIFCMSCKECPKGEGVASPCRKTADTKCQPCPKGTFSDKVSYHEPCKPCTLCDGMMTVKQECNASRNTICERANVSQTPMTPSKNLESVSLTNGPTSAGNKIQPIPIEKTTEYKYIIAIVSVGFIIVLIVAATCWYLMRKRRRYNDTNNQPEETEMTEYNFPVPATTSETPAQARSSHGLRGRRTRHARNHSEHRDTDSQGSNSSLQGVSIEKGKNKTMVRELPGHIFMELGKLLNPKSFHNWITLAGRLGFNNSDVKNFEIFPEDATQRTLEEWGQRDGSTVDILINVLKEMKRDDCVEILKSWDS